MFSSSLQNNNHLASSTEEHTNDLHNDNNNMHLDHKPGDISQADLIKKFLSKEASALGYLR